MAYLVVFGAVVASGWVSLLTFTVQSNLMIAMSFTWTAWALITDRRTPPEWLAASSIFYVSITALVFNFVVRPGSFRSGEPIFAGMSASDYAHVVIPVMAVAIWAVFEEHRRIPWRYGWIWMIYVFVYITVIALIVYLVEVVGVPYWFLDVQERGWAKVLMSLAGLLAFFVGLAFLIIGADKRLPVRTRISEYDRFDEYYLNPTHTMRALRFSGDSEDTSIPNKVDIAAT